MLGSDAAAVETTAVRNGDYYIVNGTKTFITNAHTADVGMMLASTDRSKGAKGLTAFIVDMHTPGITVSDLLTKSSAWFGTVRSTL
jgi:alkylation response protein AidB-like acyl-CoA dehydrogenase